LLLRARGGKAKPLEKRHRAKVACLQDRDEVRDPVLVFKLLEHCPHCAASYALAPVLAVEFIRDIGGVIFKNGGLNVARKASARKTNDPIEPLFFAIARATALQTLESTSKPLLVGWRFVLEFIDRRVAEDDEHVMRMGSYLRLQDAGRTEDGFHADKDDANRRAQGMRWCPSLRSRHTAIEGLMADRPLRTLDKVVRSTPG
jgi:hypothetical protein